MSELDDLKAKMVEKEKELTDLKESTKDIEDLRDDSVQFGKLVEDQDVMDLLNAKQKGEDVKVLTGEDITKSDKLPVDDNTLADLDNKGLRENILEAVPGVVKQAMEEGLQSVNESLQGVTASLKVSAQERLDRQLTDAAKKYPDILDFKDAMAKVQAGNPELSIEELYVTARLRGGKGLPVKGSTDSERPTSTVARPETVNVGSKEKKYVPGRPGFKQMVDDATEEIAASLE